MMVLSYTSVNMKYGLHENPQIMLLTYENYIPHTYKHRDIKIDRHFPTYIYCYYKWLFAYTSTYLYCIGNKINRPSTVSQLFPSFRSLCLCHCQILGRLRNYLYSIVCLNKQSIAKVFGTKIEWRICIREQQKRLEMNETNCPET